MNNAQAIHFDAAGVAREGKEKSRGNIARHIRAIDRPHAGKEPSLKELHDCAAASLAAVGVIMSLRSCQAGRTEVVNTIRSAEYLLHSE